MKVTSEWGVTTDESIRVKGDVAVLCPGPSLADYIIPSSSKVHSIAVNSAADIHGGCDWLVAFDKPMLSRMASVPRVGVLTREPNVGLSEHARTIGDRSVVPESLRRVSTHYSKLGAILLACWLGANRVLVYGDDMDGGTYADGSKMTGTYSLRWKHERKLTDLTLAWVRESTEVEMVKC